MLYIYRPTVSEGARALEETLNDNNIPARFTRGSLLRERYRPDRDAIICWGSVLPAGIVAPRVLNNISPISKFTEAERLNAAGVSTVAVSRMRPIVRPMERSYPLLEKAQTAWNRAITDDEVRRLIAELQNHLAQPLPPAEEWLPRANNHVGGSDLLQPQQADYYSRKENISGEYRIHIFKGKSIRAGQKVPREGVTPHPWIRSFDGGWRINYTGFQSSREMRELAGRAVAALSLDFGAVDLGQRPDGSLLVFEVNRAPGIEGGSLECYADRIGMWLRGELDEREQAA